MSEPRQTFNYVAMDMEGRRVRGAVVASDELSAFEAVRLQGLTPVTIRTGKGAGGGGAEREVGGLSDRDTAMLVADLGALLRAGSDIRTALGVIGTTARKERVQAVARRIIRDVSGGESLERALSEHLGDKHAFVAALVAAGEASGDLAGGLERGAELLESRMAIREQIISVISYPAFVLITAVIAFAIILLVVAPALAPLASAPGAEPGVIMSVMLGLSGFLRSHAMVILFVSALAILGLGVAWFTGMAGVMLDRFLLNGPLAPTVRGLVFGAFAIALGGILAAGAPISDALRLAMRSVRSEVARKNLESVGQSVRQGESLSSALGRVKGFPDTVIRLAIIGEESGALGQMLLRAGRLEEKTALRQIEAVGRFIGPALIVALGGVVGLLMAGLLSGLSGLGEAALQ